MTSTTTTADSPVLVCFGSETGNAEAMATQAAAAVEAAGLPVRLVDLNNLEVAELGDTRFALFSISTCGEGEMPYTAELFWKELCSDDAPQLDQLGYTLLSLGDSGYMDFCQAGRDLDGRLGALGATPLIDRIDCDFDFEDEGAAWIAASVPLLVEALGGRDDDPAVAGADAGSSYSPGPVEDEAARWSRRTPYPARILSKQLLSRPGSAKEVWHLEIDLADSGITYEAGDSLGVMPVNDPRLVAALLEALGVSPDAVLDGSPEPIGRRLLTELEIRSPARALLDLVAETTTDAEVAALLREGTSAQVQDWLWGRDVVDLVEMVSPDPQALIAALRPLQHRTYSISSSPGAHSGRVHLTVATIRHSGGGRDRGGVASTYLAERVAEMEAVSVFLMPNNHFRLPPDDATTIMIGPGTGIAPFRSFLHERAHRGARGRNWLFYGDQCRATDFAYEAELEQLLDAGVLTRLDVAFSRDQAEKDYVQHRMAEQGADLWALIEEGAYVYVCGDASRMAKDVDATLVRVIAEHGRMSAEDAQRRLDDLQRERRYLRDVY